MNIVDGVYFFVRDICTAPLPHYQHFLQSRGNNSNSTSRSNNSNSRSSSTISNNSSRVSKSNNSRSRIRGRQLAHNLNNVRHIQFLYFRPATRSIPTMTQKWRVTSEQNISLSILLPRQDRWGRRCCCGRPRGATLLLSEPFASQPSLNVNCITLVLADI